MEQLSGLSNTGIARLAASLARAPTDAKAVNDPALLARLEAIVKSTEAVAVEFTYFSKNVSAGYAATRKQVGSFLGEYRAAYAAFGKVLGKAKAEQEAKQALGEALFSFMLGVGIGIALPAAIQGIRSLDLDHRRREASTPPRFEHVHPRPERPRRRRPLTRGRSTRTSSHARDTIQALPGTPKPYPTRAGRPRSRRAARRPSTSAARPPRTSPVRPASARRAVRGASSRFRRSSAPTPRPPRCGATWRRSRRSWSRCCP